MNRRNLLVIASILVAGNNASLAFAPASSSSFPSFSSSFSAANADASPPSRTFASTSWMSMTASSSSDGGDGGDDGDGGGSTRRNFLNDAAGRSMIFAGFAASSSSSSSATTATAVVVIASSSSIVGYANALDYDAFEKGEIANDTAKCDPKKDVKCIPKLSNDEALCQYGGGGNARGEACMRVKKAGGGGKLPTTVKRDRSPGGAYAM